MPTMIANIDAALKAAQSVRVAPKVQVQIAKNEGDIILAVGWGVDSKKGFEAVEWRYYSVGFAEMAQMTGNPGKVEAYSIERPVSLETFCGASRAVRRSWAARLLKDIAV